MVENVMSRKGDSRKPKCGREFKLEFTNVKINNKNHDLERIKKQN